MKKALQNPTDHLSMNRMCFHIQTCGYGLSGKDIAIYKEFAVLFTWESKEFVSFLLLAGLY